MSGVKHLWAEEMAEEVVSLIRATQDDYGPDIWFDTMEERIARRLVKAYERGQVDMRERAADFVSRYDPGAYCPDAPTALDRASDAIRSLPIDSAALQKQESGE